MKADKVIATYHRVRQQPLWRLLAADNGPAVIALLQTELLETQRSIPSSIFHERISRSLEELRARGEDFPQTAERYIADWLASGYLERRFPAGAEEEEYELTSAAASAIRYVMAMVEPRTAATESRLAAVIQQLVRLAEESDPNPTTRVASLIAEQQRLQREIEAIQKGQLGTLSEDRALERIREIIGLSGDLTGDFRRVRDEFEQLNRSLREHIIDHEGNRGDVLNALFAGVDLISESEAGRTFAAFWKLLTDPEQSSTLEEALDQVMSRGFADQLDSHDRRFMLRLTRTLLEQGGMVHEVLQHFARSLKQFVQSQEYLEHRRLNQLLKEAQRSALTIKDQVSATATLDYTLQLTSSRIRCVSQWVLYDPSMQAVGADMIDGEAAAIGLEQISELVAQSEIDFRSLRANIRAVLDEESQASIAQVLDEFPASQGLGSIVGYVTLAVRYGLRTDGTETVAWVGADQQFRRARIPVIYFLKERLDELV